MSQVTVISLDRCARVAVGVLGELARAAAGAVGEVGVVVEVGGEFGDVGAAVLRRGRARPLVKGIAVAGLQRCAAALLPGGAVGGFFFRRDPSSAGPSHTAAC
jgi:hypothetical protein